MSALDGRIVIKRNLVLGTGRESRKLFRGQFSCKCFRR
jgi:hypothetical protein